MMATAMDPSPPPAPPDRYAALDLLADPTLVVGAGGLVEYCNAMAARLLGVPPGQVVGRPAAQAVPLFDDAQADWWECVDPLRADASLLPRIPELYLYVRPERAPPRLVTLTAARIPAAGGRTGRLVVSLRRAERRQRLDAARSDLVSTVSHELRSPLTSVKGFTKTLLAKWDRFTDEQKRQMLATVNEDADRVTRLLGELLDVSRIDAGRLQLQRHMVDVTAVVHRMVERLRARDSDDERVVTVLPPGLPRLYADPDKVEQIFTNLVENALKYSDGEVRIGATVLDRSVLFTVADRGAGIPMAHLDHIFTKFFRRPGERRTGTGLGLFITKGLVEAHGGRIWAESVPDEGARFFVSLPLGGLELAGIGSDPSEARRAL